MSQENADLWRASIEDIRAGLNASANEFDREGMISRMAELWDPEIEWDVTEAQTLDASGVYRGKEGARLWWREWASAGY